MKKNSVIKKSVIKNSVIKKSVIKMNNNLLLADDLTDLQIAVAHLEMTVDTLNQVISRQDKQITDLQRQLQLLYGYLERQVDSGIASFDLLADRPPHY